MLEAVRMIERGDATAEGNCERQESFRQIFGFPLFLNRYRHGYEIRCWLSDGTN